MGNQWTEEQQKIIDHREGNLLVSAAAGSGKTAVLVAHVISRILDPVSPVSLSQLLIMTFTEAAAEEMRKRIREALEERLRADPDNTRLIHEVGSIQNANISTIHSFCKRLISENYVLLENLDPGFRLGEEGELKLLKSDIIQELLEDRYREGEEQFLRFMDRFTRGKEDEGIEELILKLFAFAEATPWPMEYLEKQRAGSFREAEDFLLSMLRTQLLDYRTMLEGALAVCEEPEGPEGYVPMLREDLRGLREALEKTEIREMVEAMKAMPFSRLKVSKSPIRAQAADPRNLVKKGVKDLCEKKLLLPPKEKEAEMESGILEGIGVLISLTEEFIRRFQEEKETRRMLDFSDLEHKALALLYTGEGEARRPSLLADDYAQRFTEILVDEYQDSNEVQEALVLALSGERFGRPDVFQVGDVKQSIYRFRQAKPSIFLNKYEDPDYYTIELAKNFRSRASVLEATNQVFYRVMKKEVGGLAYTEKVGLHLGRSIEEKPKAGMTEEERLLFEKEEQDRYRTELLLTEYGEGRNEETGTVVSVERVEAETRMIAKRIKKLIAEGRSFRDIVILMRSPSAWADTMISVLAGEGIPAYSISNEGYFSAVEVETVLALLSIIDNPRQSIPLAAVMRSPMYQFTDEELAEIVLAQGSLEKSFEAQEEEKDGKDGKEKNNVLSPALSEKLANFYQSIRVFREKSRILSIHELLYEIYEKTNFYEYASAMPAGKKRRANLDQLIDSALAFEATSYRGLFDYIRYIEKLKKYHSDQGEAAIYSEQENLVRILSIHKSKGLQFPVVFLAGLGKSFNGMDLRGQVLVEESMGIATDYIDVKEKLRYSSLKKLAIQRKLEQELYAEELRILYVGMTRAEDKLIMTAGVSNMEKLLDGLQEPTEPLSGTQIMGAGCYLDWILMAEGTRLLETSSGRPIQLETYYLGDLFDAAVEVETAEAEEAYVLREKILTLSEDSRLSAERESLSFSYPFAEATRLYPMHSVSEIKMNHMEELGEGVIIEAIKKEPELPEAEEAAGKKNTQNRGAQVGDAYHHALASYDYEKGPEQIFDLLPESEASLIRPEKLRVFTESPLGKRFREGQRLGTLYREQSFMQSLPYQRLFPESEIRESVLLQGIIDAFLLEEDGITVVDYKTDRVKDAETLLARYSIQLRLYADALHAITGKPIKGIYLYSFALEKEVEIV